MGSPSAKHVPVVLTALLVHSTVVRILQLLAPLEPMPVGQLPFVIHAVLGNTTNKQAKRLNRLLVKVALLDNTKTTVGNPRAKHVPVVLTAVSVHRVVLGCTRNARVASVATVVVVGVKLPRRPRVKRGRRRCVGLTRQRGLLKRRHVWKGVIMMCGEVAYSSTNSPQPGAVAATEDVSAP